MLEITRLNPCDYTHVHVAHSLQAMYNVDTNRQAVCHTCTLYMCVFVSLPAVSAVYGGAQCEAGSRVSGVRREPAVL